MKHLKIAALCLIALVFGAVTTFAQLPTDDLGANGSDAPPHEPTSPTTETDVDNLDGTWTFTQQVDEYSTPPNYNGPWSAPSGTYGFEYYSWFDGDYGWLHTFPHWSHPSLTIISASLTIHAWDIDSEPEHGWEGEYDGVHVDGSLLSPGYLQGTTNTWSTTVFDLPLISITDDGNINTFLDIDMHHTEMSWATTLNYSRMEIVYSTTEVNLPPYQPVLDYSLAMGTDCADGAPCANNGQDLVVTVIGPTPADPDGDVVTYNYRWFVDIGTGGFIDDEFAGRGDHTGNTVPLADIQPNDIWQVQVIPVDEHGAIGNMTTLTFPEFCTDPSECNLPPVALCTDPVVSADGNCEGYASIDNGSYDPDGDPITIYFDPTGPYPLGATVVRLIVVDDSFLADTCFGTVTVVDDTPPVATCPDDITVGNDAGMCGAVVQFAATATDNCSATISCTPPSGSYFPVGVTAVTCIAVDGSGNADTCGFTVTVDDTEDPVAICSGDIVSDNDEDSCGAVVTFSADVTDNCPGAVVDCVPPSGSYFAVGTTVVTCTATDAAANTGTCNFNVTVNDVQAPDITCPATVTVQCPVDVPQRDVSLIVSSDNCDVDSVWHVGDESDGQTCPETITRTYSARDIHDNVAECEQLIIVDDTIAPVCTPPDDHTFTLCESEQICLPFGCEDNCGAVATVIEGPGEIIGDQWCYTPTGNESSDVTVRCEDDCGNYCDATFHVTVWMTQIRIAKLHDVLQGNFSSVSITMEGADFEMGGFDFLIAYDASALTPVDVEPGQLLGDCEWEYFSYRFGPDGNCGDACPSGLLRIIAIANTDNGPYHPSCYGPPDTDPHELASMKFLVTNDRTFECQYTPIGFYWIECVDNTISSVDGELLYLDYRLFDYTYNLIWDEDDDVMFPEDERIPHVGAPDYCLNTDPEKPTPIRRICFVDGGVDIICAKDIDDRGDLNLDGLAYTIADAVIFSNYFVYGLSAFPDVAEHSIDGAIAASDVNADGRTLTVADLVYLVRVVVGDAQPYDDPFLKIDPVAMTYRMDDGVVSVDGQIGAAWIVIEGEREPSNLTDEMDMKYNFDGENTRILIFNLDNKSCTGEILQVAGEVVQFELSTDKGEPVSTSLIPNDFALYQCYPNPFNPVTTITFNLGVTTDYRLTIYNVNGQVIDVLDGHHAAGLVEIVWDASMRASGVYMYRLEASGFADTKKMILLK